LRSLFLLHIEFIRKNPGIPKLVFSDAAVFGSPERKKKVIFIVRNYMNKLKEIAEKGIREGDLMNDISSEAVAFLWSASPSMSDLFPTSATAKST